MNELELRTQQLKILEQKIKLKEGLPHLYGLKMYKWQKEYFEEITNKMWFLAAGNQLGKSSIQIRKGIHIATCKELWAKMWPDRVAQFADFKPTIWYLYPNQDTVKQETHEKWIPEFLPRGEFKNHPVYGWKLIVENRVVKAIRFNSGVSIYFKTYSQNVQDLQAGSCSLISCFTKGNYTYTNSGIKDISEVAVGDMVLTRNGFRMVYNTFKHETEVIERVTSCGVKITGTNDHPFILKGRIKRFDKLDENDSLWTVSIWRLLCAIWQTKNLFYLKEIFTIGIRSLMTLGKETISDAVETRHFILHCGNLTIIRLFQRVMLYTIRILTHLITVLKILNLSADQSTQGYTSSKSGRKKSTRISSVQSVVKNFYQGLLRTVRLDIALKSVEDQLSNLTACIVGRKKKLDQMLERCTVHQPVQTKQTVYNISVEQDHEYYINGILVHNCDEELPEDLYPELRARLIATQGYFSMVFTATLGQEFWRLAIQPDKDEPENFPTAFKRQVSAYDCKTYWDGTPSKWTDERIQTEIDACKNKSEVDRRIFGKFIKEGDKKYYAFNAEKHYVPFPSKNGKTYRGVPSGWSVYSAVDCGSGGENNHPAAFVFVMVSPDFTKLRVFKGRRLDKIETTASDVYDFYKQSRGSLTIERQMYDWASKDFDTITSRAGDKFYKAEKNHAIGEQLLNSLFKRDMLLIYQDTELVKLKYELENLSNKTLKNHAKDDFIDALRYVVASIPVDWEKVFEIVDKGVKKSAVVYNEERELRSRDFEHSEKIIFAGVDDEFDEWNDLY